MKKIKQDYMVEWPVGWRVGSLGEGGQKRFLCIADNLAKGIINYI